MLKRQLIQIHNEYIQGKAMGEFVVVETFEIAELSKKIISVLKVEFNSVTISTKALKHICERRSLEIYDIIITKLASFIEDPDFICKNKDGGKSEVVLAKLNEELYLMIFLDVNLMEQRFEIRTVHPIDKSNLKKFPIIWDKGGTVNPSS